MTFVSQRRHVTGEGLRRTEGSPSLRWDNRQGCRESRARMAERTWLKTWAWMPTALPKVALLLCAGMPVGCFSEQRAQPVFIANPDLGSMTIAVAPALNQSGSADFDPSRFADLMASELSYADGISVIPVSRVLAVLAAHEVDHVKSPAHALELLGWLGADAVLVFAVTEYDPYDPPNIGITAQLYGARPGRRGGTMDPIALSRNTTLAASVERGSPRGLLAQTQRVFDASHDSIVDEVRAFARRRDGDASPYGWRKYVVSQQHFIRYCSYATIRTLLDWQDDSTLAEGDLRAARMP